MSPTRQDPPPAVTAVVIAAIAVGIAAILAAGAFLVTADDGVIMTPPPLAVSSGDPGRGVATAAGPTSPRDATTGTAARTAVAAAPPAADRPDRAWLALARQRRDVVRDLVVRPHEVDVDDLLRSTAFNPGDRFLAPAQRAAIAAVLAERARQLDDLAATGDLACRRELPLAEAAGMARGFDLAVRSGDLALFGLGDRPILRSVDGRTVAIARSHAPETARLERRLRAGGVELTGRLAAAFAAAGALDDDAAGSLVEQARRVAGAPWSTAAGR